MRARRRLEYVVAEVAYRRSPHVALVGVDEEVRLKEDLIVAPVHIVIRMVVADEVDEALRHPRREVDVLEELLRQRAALRLLMIAVRIAVFFTTEWAGDVVQDRGDLHGLLLRRREILRDADGSGKGIDLHKVCYIVQIALRVGNHLLHDIVYCLVPHVIYLP